ncbi:MAG TPA: hypothetical protein VFG10_14375 [Saprospiraceae bacterium]|nr:hypothetical protein [Saprospiraceae bacterium]
MRRIECLTLLSIFLLISISCREEDHETIGLAGKWLLFEISHTGQAQWETVPVDVQDIIELLPDGHFIQTEHRGNPLPNVCSGTYLLISDTQLRVNSSCQQHETTWNISLFPDALILTFRGREENLFQKYIRVE